MNQQKYWIGRCPAADCQCAKHVETPANAPEYWRPWHLALECQKHAKRLVWQKVNGKFSRAHVCDVRCMTATGPDCECSCGGANHGRGFHVTTTFETVNQLELV